MDKLDFLRDHVGHIKRNRDDYEAVRRNVQQYVLPLAGANDTDGFNTKGGRPYTHYDDTAVIACERYAGFISQYLIPANRQWHKLKSTVDDLKDNKEVAEYFAAVNDILFKERYNARSGFREAMRKYFVEIAAFGNACMIVEDVPGEGIRYRTLNTGAVWWKEDKNGFLDTFLIRWDLTLRQIEQQFSYNNMTEKMQGMLGNNSNTVERVLQLILPIKDIPKNIQDDLKVKTKDQRYYVFYVDEAFEKIIKEEAHYIKPVTACRTNNLTGEIYGHGPAYKIINTIAALNRLQHDYLTAAEYKAKPAYIATNDLIQQYRPITPNSIIYGGIDAEGRPALQSLLNNSDLSHMQLKIAEMQRTINDAFLLTLFQILAENPQMTATEVIERSNEKYTLLSSPLHQIADETFPDLVARELDILYRQQRLPEIPQQLVQAGVGYDIQYDNPFARLFGSDEIKTMLEFYQSVVTYSQTNPDAMMIFDEEQALRRQAQLQSLHPKIIRSDEVVQAMKEQRAEAQQEQQAMEQMNTLAQAEQRSAMADKAAKEAQFG